MKVLVAAKDVRIGFNETDPDDPLRMLVVEYKEGDEIDRDPRDIPNLEGLVTNGYLDIVERADDAVPE